MKSTAEKEQIMEDLYGVGKTKMLGYLPLRTVTDLCGQNLDKVTETLVSRDLFVCTFNDKECDIFSGAIYVADLNQLQDFLTTNKGILSNAQWSSDAKIFIRQVANETATDPEVYDLIAMTFNDPRLTAEQRLYAYPIQNLLPKNDTASKFKPKEISQIREKFNSDSNSIITLKNK